MSDARTLALALGGHWHRRYGLACCPAHGDRKPSLTLADGADGRLLLHCKSGCTFTDVLDALRARGLIDGHVRPHAPDPAELARRASKERREAERTERRALATWRESRPIRGTVAETYLRHRGISCDLPETLRFHPDCWHPSSQRLPAMVALVEGLERAAIHRTYLRPDGRGKSGMDPAKAMQGRTQGGAVRLSRANGPLVVAEGIETALSLLCGLLHEPATVWGALSAPGMAALRLPGRPHLLTVAPDGDVAGREAAHKLAARADVLGWSVSLLSAPEGRDWNDILQANGGAA